MDVADLALEFVKSHTEIPIVFDPVLVCKENTMLKHQLCVMNFKFFHMLQSSPNLVEAELLAQTSIKTLDDMKAAAKRL